MALRVEVCFFNYSEKDGAISNEVADEGQIEERMDEDSPIRGYVGFGKTIITGEGSVAGHFNITLGNDNNITVTYSHPGDDDEAHIELDNYIPFEGIEMTTSKTIVGPGNVQFKIEANQNHLQQSSSDEDDTEDEPAVIANVFPDQHASAAAPYQTP